MRTPPAKYLTDFDSGKSLFYVLKVVSDTTTRYWHTARETFTLWDTTVADVGHIALTKDNTRLAEQVIDSGGGEQMEAVTSIETGLDIEEYGSGPGEIGGFNFVILNQDDFSDTVNAENFTYKSVELYMGFVDTTNGVGLGDMLKVQSYVTEQVQFYDQGQVAFQCVDGEINRDKLIPQTIVTKINYPRAANESLGAPLPMVYGAFRVPTVGGIQDNFAIAHGNINAVPTVVTNIGNGIRASQAAGHTGADHAIDLTTILVWYTSGESAAQVLDVSYKTDGDGRVLGIWLPEIIEINWFLVPNVVYAPFTTQTETDANQFDFICDPDLTNTFTTNNTGGGHLYFSLSQPYDGDTVSTDVTFNVRFGTIPAGVTTLVRGARISDSVTTNSAEATSLHSNSDFVRTLGIFQEPTGVGNPRAFAYGFVCSGALEIKALYINVTAEVNKRAIFDLNPSYLLTAGRVRIGPSRFPRVRIRM